MEFVLNASLSSDAIRQEFEDRQYVHVPEILADDNASQLHHELTKNTPWSLVFTDRGKHVDLSGANLQAMSKEQVLELQKAIYAQAQTSFQYCYNNYPIFDVCKAGKNKGHVLHKFYEWLNSEAFLTFARSATGFDDISFVDAQATAYRPGHFLTTHDDTQEGKRRRAAYVFNFTPDWSADWGGFLQLLDDKGNIRHGLRPAFNALNIIAVPQRHNVSLVAPFAGAVRTSITGWFRYGDPD